MNEEVQDEIIEISEARQAVMDTDDGGAIVAMDEESTLGADANYEFYDNIVELVAQQMGEGALDAMAVDLLEKIDRDKKARQKRDKEYAESIRRTGLGDDAPGGAEFDGASRVVHPMLTEASVDFASRAIKEIYPGNGPVRVYVPGENPDPARVEKAERKKNYMNWQFLVQMPEFRTELDQLLPQLALGGSQYMRITPDSGRRRARPVPLYVSQDLISIPYAASSFYTAERQTYHEPVTRAEFETRVRDKMYRSIGQLTNYQDPEQTAAQKASDKVEGKETTDFYNQDGLRTVHECSCWQDLGEDPNGTPLPYMVSIDEPTRKIVAIVRNWEQQDEHMERMQWVVEFPFVPWRGAYTIGFGQMIGSLSAAATGALRALLDSALVNNIPTAVRLKGANFSGQTRRINATEVVELDGGIAGDDVRKLLMALPFGPPSPVLFELLGFLVNSGRSVVQTTFENVAEGHPNMPVGTTLALIEEGMRVYSAIHLRLYHAMTYVIRVVHRIDRMYLTEEEVKDDVGVLLAYRSDFEEPLDCVPTADPEVFSDIQRMAQLQVVADRATQLPQIYNVRAVEKRLLERTKISNPEELLLPEPMPEEMNQVNENMAMTLGRPVSAFPEQDHLGHIQVLLDFLRNPVLGQLPNITPSFLPAAMEHLKEHILFWYVTSFYEILESSIGTDEAGMKQIMNARDPESRKELDRTLAAASPLVNQRATQVLQGIPPIVAEAMQKIQEYQKAAQDSQIPVDPNAMAAVEAQRERTQVQAQTQMQKEQATTEREQLRAQSRMGEKVVELRARDQSDVRRLSAEERKQALAHAREEAAQAADLVIKLEELAEKERAEDERLAARLESDERRNTQDNLTALKIAAAELELAAKQGKDAPKSSLTTGTGINPQP